MNTLSRILACSACVALLLPLEASSSAENGDPVESTRVLHFPKDRSIGQLAKDYPGAVRKLDSPDPKQQIVGIKTLAATDEVPAIPWIVPLIDSKDRNVRIHAGQALNALVASHELKRRDKSQPEKVVIRPPGPGDLDLKPMAWVILKMLRMPDDGNTHSYAANMIGYLKLGQFERRMGSERTQSLAMWPISPLVTKCALTPKEKKRQKRPQKRPFRSPSFLEGQSPPRGSRTSTHPTIYPLPTAHYPLLTPPPARRSLDAPCVLAIFAGRAGACRRSGRLRRRSRCRSASRRRPPT